MDHGKQEERTLIGDDGLCVLVPACVLVPVCVCVGSLQDDIKINSSHSKIFIFIYDQHVCWCYGL